MHDPGAVLAIDGDHEGNVARGSGDLFELPRRHDEVEAPGRFLQGGVELVGTHVRRRLDQKDHGELVAQPAHRAIGQVAAEGQENLREAGNDAGPVLADGRDGELTHRCSSPFVAPELSDQAGGATFGN